MILQNTATFRFRLYDYSKGTAKEFSREIYPDCLHKQWIPQTLGEQVWVWYEFESKELKDEFLNTLPEKWTYFFCNKFEQSTLNHYADDDAPKAKCVGNWNFLRLPKG